MFGKYKKYTEGQLIELLKQGCEGALKEIYLRYENKLFNYTLKFTQSQQITAEIVQDTFIKLWENRDQLNNNNECGLAPWLFKVSKNSILNHVRQAVKFNSFKKEYSLAAETYSNDVEETIYLKECISVINRAVEELPTQCKSIFNLSRTEGKSYEEIADILAISKSTVRLQIIKSLKSIRHHLDVTMN
jgi:RNA polymerase sigma-70 factor (family 1)